MGSLAVLPCPIFWHLRWFRREIRVHRRKEKKEVLETTYGATEQKSHLKNRISGCFSARRIPGFGCYPPGEI